MQLIADIQEYKELIRWNKSRFPEVQGNCVSLAGSFEKFIKNGRFYAEKHENGIAFYADEGTYLNLFYFWNAEKEFSDFRKDKPVVVEVLNVNGNRDAYLDQYEPALLRAGFKKYRKNYQVSADMREQKEYFEQEYARRVERLKEKGMELVMCNDSESFQQAVSLWDAYLEMTDIPNEHRTLGGNDKVLNVVSKEGRLAATTWWRQTGRGSEGRHVVTHPDFYQNGLATVLEMGWILDGFEHGVNRWIGWVNEDNFKSQGLLGKLGFRTNGRVSVQYILE